MNALTPCSNLAGQNQAVNYANQLFKEENYCEYKSYSLDGDINVQPYYKTTIEAQDGTMVLFGQKDNMTLPALEGQKDIENGVAYSFSMCKEEDVEEFEKQYLSIGKSKEQISSDTYRLADFEEDGVIDSMAYSSIQYAQDGSYEKVTELMNQNNFYETVCTSDYSSVEKEVYSAQTNIKTVQKAIDTDNDGNYDKRKEKFVDYNKNIFQRMFDSICSWFK